MTADPGDGAVLDEELVEGDALANLRTGFAGRVDEELVEDGPPGQYEVAAPPAGQGLPLMVTGPKSNE
jgi:hypothetical protein